MSSSQSTKETVDISIFSRSFSLVTTSNHAPTLQASAAYLHDKMKTMSQHMQQKDFDKLVVTASLNIIGELGERIQIQNQRIKALSEGDRTNAARTDAQAAAPAQASASAADSSDNNDAIAELSEQISAVLSAKN